MPEIEPKTVIVAQPNESQQLYLYQQRHPHVDTFSARDQQQIYRLLDDLRQTKNELREARRDNEVLMFRIGQMEAQNQALKEQLRYWQQQGSQWHKRLRQTEALLKRVIRKNRELSQQVMQATTIDAKKP